MLRVLLGGLLGSVLAAQPVRAVAAADPGTPPATATAATTATTAVAAAPTPAGTARFAGKVAIVTGGSRGIGRAISETLARDGATVVVNYSKSTAAAQQVVETIEARGGRAIAIQADISRIEDVRRLYAEVQQQFGRIDIVVNNAGILPPVVPVEKETEATWDAVFGLLKGTYFSMQEAARRIHDGGRIINLSSSTTRGWSPGYSIYAGSKSAIEQFTRSLSRELGPRGITVNAIVPGLTDTDMIGDYPPALREAAAKGTTLGRLGQPRDIADVVAFLASDEGRWITGQMVVANGGLNP
ncbi:MAG: glucose 1-dehydrogenase [Sinobacteraceae bacterium]|nr:glucose 1-dehydrogenase [Nevskiaceae bacterium]MCP5466331.1 glucose 1-dehydrogenase [Nevskiaceae bacterium]MCP5471733.1 glucose 1-dehydrogenase [Nevskiaceae bacterium]